MATDSPLTVIVLPVLGFGTDEPDPLHAARVAARASTEDETGQAAGNGCAWRMPVDRASCVPRGSQPSRTHFPAILGWPVCHDVPAGTRAAATAAYRGFAAAARGRFAAAAGFRPREARFSASTASIATAASMRRARVSGRFALSMASACSFWWV